MKDLTNVIVAQEEMVKAGFNCPKLATYWTQFLAVETELKNRGAL